MRSGRIIKPTLCFPVPVTRTFPCSSLPCHPPGFEEVVRSQGVRVCPVSVARRSSVTGLEFCGVCEHTPSPTTPRPPPRVPRGTHPMSVHAPCPSEWMFLCPTSCTRHCCPLTGPPPALVGSHFILLPPPLSCLPFLLSSSLHHG